MREAMLKQLAVRLGALDESEILNKYFLNTCLDIGFDAVNEKTSFKMKTLDGAERFRSLIVQYATIVALGALSINLKKGVDHEGFAQIMHAQYCKELDNWTQRMAEVN